MENSKNTVRVTVRGYVQGVGFRVFIQSAGRHLGVRGFVKNMPDGTVQVFASGDKLQLDKLIDEIWRGPAGAHVAFVDTSWEAGETAVLPAQFEVK